MLFPNEKILFIIPIYLMPKNIFEEKWKKWKSKWCEMMKKRVKSQEEIDETMDLIMTDQYPRNIWKYNQIVGFIEVAITSRDIVFNECRTLDKRIRVFSNKKHFIQDLHTNGKHFPIGKLENEEIVRNIDEYILSINKRLPGKMWLDMETYDIVKHHIDFNGIHKELFEIENIHN